MRRCGKGCAELEEFFILPGSYGRQRAELVRIPDRGARDAPFTRNQVTQYLEERKIATRLLFGGNLVRQPAYRDRAFRVVGSLKNADFVMNQVFWIGVYPGIGPEILDYMLETLHAVAASGVIDNAPARS